MQSVPRLHTAPAHTCNAHFHQSVHTTHSSDVYTQYTQSPIDIHKLYPSVHRSEYPHHTKDPIQGTTPRAHRATIYARNTHRRQSTYTPTDFSMYTKHTSINTCAPTLHTRVPTEHTQPSSIHNPHSPRSVHIQTVPKLCIHTSFRPHIRPQYTYSP